MPAKSSRAWWRAFRAAQSWLTGLAWPLGGWWFGSLSELRTEPRLRNGAVIVLPGVEGKSSLNRDLALGLAEGGVGWAVEVHDWTTGLWPLFAYHLRCLRRSRRRAARIAAQVVAYQDRFPGRPTFLVGHSGGGALAVLVLECLPPSRQVTAALLLGPALSRRYDLSVALARTERGLWNFYSPLDLVFLTAGTFVFGTLDGRHAVSAGAWGFARPARLSSRGRRLYRTRLHQRPYEPAMAGCGHLAGHLGWANRAFAAAWLAPVLDAAGRP
jgi:pimeloyl-ACP methyl ester carboxylesterase